MHVLDDAVGGLCVGELHECLVSHGEEFVDVEVLIERVVRAGRLSIDDCVRRLLFDVHLFRQEFELRR